MKQKLIPIVLSFSSFIALGIPGALLGVAWPSIQSTFGMSIDAVGTLLLAFSIGYLVLSFASGRLIARIGLGLFLLASTLMIGIGLLGQTLAPAWWSMVLFGVFAGAGGGAIDAGLNTYFATNHSPGLMNWLHASYGLGATIGPALMTVVLEAGLSWRWGYGLAMGAQVLLAVGFLLTLKWWWLGKPGSSASDADPADHAYIGETLRVFVVWLGIALFFVFTGVEASAGQWPYSLFTAARGIDPAVAGFWVSVYWGSLTVGRIVFGVAANRFRVVTLLRIGIVGAVVGAGLIWWDPAPLWSFWGLALMGFCIAPVFPLSISATPGRVGQRHAANAIGFQVAAASVGLAALPGLAGVLARYLGLEIIGPFLLVITVAMLLIHEVTAGYVARKA